MIIFRVNVEVLVVKGSGGGVEEEERMNLWVVVAFHVCHPYLRGTSNVPLGNSGEFIHGLFVTHFPCVPAPTLLHTPPAGSSCGRCVVTR